MRADGLDVSSAEAADLLRVDDQRFRTCLDCLGQGRALQVTGDGLFFRVVSATSVSASR